MAAHEHRYGSRVCSKHRSLQALRLRRWCLVRGETRAQTRQHRSSCQGCPPAASHRRHRNVAEWCALGSGRSGPPSPQHRHDRLLRQGGCRATQTDRSAVAGGEFDDYGCRNLSCRTACRRLHSQQYRISPAQLCRVRDQSEANAYPHSNSHSTGPAKRDRSRNDTSATRPCASLLSTFARRTPGTNRHR